MCGFSEIFGIKIAIGNREELFSAASELIGVGGSISTVNPEILYNSLRCGELYEALSESLNIPDGIGVVQALKRRGASSDRYPGVELGEALLDIKPVKLAIIGGKPGVAEDALDKLILRHPLSLYGFAQDGYSYTDDGVKILMESHSPDIVFVCLGSPLQELFIKRMKKSYPGVLFVALGGSSDIYSERKKRAPLIFRRSGTEWIFRIMLEPKRIFRLPKIFAFVIKSRKEGNLVRKSRKKALKFAKTE